LSPGGFLGPLDEEDIAEPATAKCSVDLETNLADGIHMRMHAGPGLLGGGKTDPEVKFILDGDFSRKGPITADKIPQNLIHAPPRGRTLPRFHDQHALHRTGTHIR